MRVAFSINMLMQECCQFICQWENGLGGVPLRIKHLLHSSAVRYGEKFHSPSAREISRHNYLTLTRVIRGHLQTKIFTLNVIVTLKGGGGSLANEHDVNF